MNANNSFRTSITVLTVATIVGCAVILFSVFSQFRFRSSGHDKSQVSAADQKLRNRFGEFYPVEQRIPVVELANAATSTSKQSENVIHSVSQSSTFDETVTTTSDYDTSEVVTSWSSGTSAGTPQVSVPVTINVNNGDLMATLIETREKLAEMKVQQSANRDDHRVFSYQVHESEEKYVTNSGTSADASVPSDVHAENFADSHEEQSSARSAKTEVDLHQQSTSGKRGIASNVLSTSAVNSDRSNARTPSRVEMDSVHQANAGSRTVVPFADTKSPADSMVSMRTKPATDPLTGPSVNSGIAIAPAEKATEKPYSATITPDFSVEEEVSFEPIAPPQGPATETHDNETVPVIEPISYSVEESVEESTHVTRSTPGTESTRGTESSRATQSGGAAAETVVQFAPLDDTGANLEAPASLPELSFDQSLQDESSEGPVLSIESKTTTVEVSKSSTVTGNSSVTSAEPSLPDFFAAEANTAAEHNVAAEGQSRKILAISSGRNREQLSKTFAAVRGLPPEDLFNDPTSEFVVPMVAAEPVPETPVPEVPAPEMPATEVPVPPVFPDSTGLASAAQSVDDGKVSTTSPPTISFIESAGDHLVVHPSSAASPVELEFGEPSVPVPSLTQSENPGLPNAPEMPLAEQKQERWHKYRSRIHQKYGSSPSTPVPPAPEVAVREIPEMPGSSFNEPSLVPPAVEDSLAESGLNSSEIGNTITDSPSMIPDEDGTTEMARNSASEKLSSSSLPPIPELAPVPALGEQFNDAGNQSDRSLVYEPQPVMDQIQEIHSELNSPPMVSSSTPMMTPRRMPQKSASKMPFATTFRRIHKRVAWMSDAMHSSENKTAQHNPGGTSSPKKKPAQTGIPGATENRGPMVARKSSPSQPMQLPKLPMPKLTVPKFTVQNFALPKVNFRPIPAPSMQMPMLDTPDWLACPPDVLAPVRNSTTLHRVMSTVQFAGQPQVLK